MLARLTARRSAPRAAVSKTAAQMPGVLFARRGSTHAQGLPLSPTVERLLRNSYNALDEAAPQMLRTLEESDAPLIWHKHSSFLDHLRGVWLMLVAWEQPQAVCRLGLFHSAYSNSFISMNLYDPTRDRAALTELIGAAAEGLVYIFCSIDRQQLEEMVLEEGVVRAEGYALRHIRTGESLHVSGAEAAAFVTETLADELEQRFGWQSDLEAGDVAAVWPGAFLPTLRMSRTNALALALRASGLVPPERLPPIFRRCSARLQPEDEEASRALYWAAVSAPPGREAGGGTAAEQLAQLEEAARRNPFVGEPHLVRAQLLLLQGRWAEAEGAAACGVALLAEWATAYDKRMPWNAWLNWGRCLALQAALHEWPTTHGGLESLGATHPRMRFRGLNTSRRAASTTAGVGV